MLAWVEYCSCGIWNGEEEPDVVVVEGGGKTDEETMPQAPSVVVVAENETVIQPEKREEWVKKLREYRRSCPWDEIPLDFFVDEQVTDDFGSESHTLEWKQFLRENMMPQEELTEIPI